MTLVRTPAARTRRAVSGEMMPALRRSSAFRNRVVRRRVVGLAMRRVSSESFEDFVGGA